MGALEAGAGQGYGEYIQGRAGSLASHGGAEDLGGHDKTASEAAAPASASTAGALLPPPQKKKNFLGDSRGSLGHLRALRRHGHWRNGPWRGGHWRPLSRSGLWRALSRSWHWRALWRHRHSIAHSRGWHWSVPLA